MRISRLEIFGFKSFVDRFVLNFDHSLIGIVGPNGCGKSNIVDALRWVLGETHAKQLRGSLLEDLIFNGSDSRRPLGMAEVSITIRSNGRWTPQLLLNPMVDAQAEANSEAIVEGELQTEPSDVELSTDPNNLPTALDASENGNGAFGGALESPSSLLEIPGLFETSEIQLTRRLYRSGESEYFINRVPCRLRDMVELYRLIGLGARGLSIVQQGQIGELITRKPLERRELLEEAAGISGFRARIEAAQRKLEKTTLNMSRLDDLIIEIDKQVRVLKRQAKRAEQRAELKLEIQQAEFELFRLRSAKVAYRRQMSFSEREHLDNLLLNSENELLAKSAYEQEQRALIDELDVQAIALRHRRDDVARQLDLGRLKEGEIRLALTRIEQQLELKASGLKSLEARGHELERTKEQHAAEGQDLQQKLGEIESQKQEAESALNDLVIHSSTEEVGQASDLNREIDQLELELEQFSTVLSQLGTLEAEILEKQKDVEHARAALHQNQLRLARLKSEVETLERQLKSMADVAMSEFSVEGETGRILSSGLKIPIDLQAAVYAVLGERENFLVSGNPAGLAEKYLNSRREGKASNKVGVLSENASDSWRDDTQNAEAACPEARNLLELIEVVPEFKNVASVLLGHVFLVPTLEHGLAFIESLQGRKPETMAVTHQGDVVTAWGWYTTEGRALTLPFAKRIDDLRAELGSVELVREQSEAELAQAQSRLNAKLASKTALEAQREQFLGVQRKLRELTSQQQAVERQTRDSALAEERNRRQKVQALAAEQARVQSEVDFHARRVTELGQERERLATEAFEIQQQLEQLGVESHQLTSTLGDILNENRADNQNILMLKQALVEIDHDLVELERRRDQARQASAALSHELVDVRRRHDKLRDERNNLELLVEKGDVELRLLSEDFERHNPGAVVAVEVETAASVMEQFGDSIDEKLQELQDQAQRLRARMEREGEVDPESIERFKEESARLDGMRAQYDDLHRAKQTLDKTIRHLKEISRRRFLDTFLDVQDRFDKLVPRLFGGGAGKLELIDPEDPLASGVELTIRPPGKKLKSMELLSGGEKALAATALLMSMFLHRPSPICVLDEVDAPLDDANLERFLSLIREISDSTQFLVITHNKNTMAALDRLIGITMQESGVSTALSVTFEAAEAELERLAANA